jgi:chorismate synthase
MAFTSAIEDSSFQGNKKKTWGTYTNSGGGIGGDIKTGLRICEGLTLKPKGSAVSANASVINETFPVLKTSAQTSAQVTIVTDENQVGTWEAFGR